MYLNNSAAKCAPAPTPADAKLNLPGLAFAYAMSCDTEVTGSAAVVTSR